MKLKNRKTGEIVELKLLQVNDKYLEDHEVYLLNGEKLTLKSLADSFDDVKDPLIKDEKIRKAVRAWAEANDVLEVFIDRIGDGTYIELYDEGDGRRRISALRPAGLKTGEAYTIDELCGEEEE